MAARSGGQVRRVSDFSLGVEEEFQLVDAETGELRPHVDAVLPEARESLGEEVQPELQRSMIEIDTPVCSDLDEVRRELVRLRREVATAAEATGCRIAALGTHPNARWEEQEITGKARYERMAAAYRRLAWDQLICGCHVHVGIADRELAIAALTRLRPWLAPLLALSANSPFWESVDTGYASYRTELWARWPTAGPPGEFASRAEYDALVDALLASGTIRDAGMVYFDVRPSQRFETLEVRVADVGLTVDHAVLLGGLVRALVRTAAEAAQEERPFPRWRPELVRGAHWRAARWGMTAELVSPVTGRPAPARDVVEELLDHVRPALEASGDLEEVIALVDQVHTEGTGAERQRAAYARRWTFDDVIAMAVEATVP
jgi:glutamate---cysteine ligase / carboxylate-amine ligase